MPAEPQPLPPRPQPPSEDDCCHQGCAPCIFDLYERELERWEEQVAAAQPAATPAPTGVEGPPPTIRPRSPA
ncbi:hypothetical protein ED208_11045 [Stagnimonas aquatica]|uniref:Oxidoreductase-like domain-containing protein n=1 Tax=Stagnimonas aquatica TaxID=2689987 RepID=A0A3N0VAH0_9GAMM|nr:hypothetical protein ED208_11045 [Stagnimonas aquatica]